LGFSPAHRIQGADRLECATLRAQIVDRDAPRPDVRVAQRGDRTDAWQADVFAVPSIVDEDEVWATTLEATAGHRGEAFQVLVSGDDTPLAGLAIRSGFTMTDELSGTSWMDADQRPSVTQVDGFTIVDRVTSADRPHPMIARNGELVEPRLRQCSLYDPTLDLAVEDADGTVAGYALFWFDPTTLVGLLEPMRVEDDYRAVASPVCC